MTFEEARGAFPVLERYAYLNAGTFGPLARATLEAMDAQQRRDGEHGRGGLPYFEAMFGLRERVRAKLAATIGVDVDRLALTSSTTDGCNIAVSGLNLDPDDEIVTTDSEHFGLVGPLIVAGARIRIARVRDRPAAEALDAILAEVGPRTRLLALSHVSWINGHVLPVQEAKEATGLPVLVDGAQSVGAIPVDASGYDFYTVSAQKWLCGPEATGALYIADPDALALTTPTYMSQAEYDLEAATFVPRPGAPRFDSGWIATPALAGLDAVLDLHPAWAHERAAAVTARCRELLGERFDVVSEPGQATLVSFRLHGDTEAVARTLYERGVVVRDLPGTGLLRVSCGYWTSEEDLERLVEALA